MPARRSPPAPSIITRGSGLVENGQDHGTLPARRCPFSRWDLINNQRCATVTQTMLTGDEVAAGFGRGHALFLTVRGRSGCLQVLLALSTFPPSWVLNRPRGTKHRRFLPKEWSISCERFVWLTSKDSSCMVERAE